MGDNEVNEVDEGDQKLTEYPSTMESKRMEMELLKERRYFSMYKAWLRKHRGILQQERDGDTGEFAHEQELIERVIASQRQKWMAGVGIGLAAFASLHFAPNLLIRWIGGEAKIKALREADRQARENGTLWVRRSTAILVEGAFSIWAGNRAYHLAVRQSEDTYDLIAKVPLCAGRSLISEKMCSEFMDITNNQIPQAFWQNLNKGNLRDEQEWKAIRQFSINCARRQRYEAHIRKTEGITNHDKSISLPRDVTEFEFEYGYVDELSSTEAQKLVTDGT